MFTLVVTLATAFATGLLLFPLRAALRRAGVVDRPNARSSHQLPTVRGAGLAIVAVIAGVLALLSCSSVDVLRTGADVERVTWTAFERFDERLGVLFAAFVALAIVSFIDDLKGLPARIRFAVHAACAVMAVVVLIRTNVEPGTVNAGSVALITNNSHPITFATVGLAAVATLWIAGYTNAFNFMDGINGIAGMQALVTAIGTGMIACRLGVPATAPVVLLAFAVAGAALGFLPHNFPRARVFMGDVSSATLGFLLATLAYWVAEMTSWWVLFWIGLLHANFVLDTAVTLVRRALRGDRLHEAHREHFYQRLVRASASHTAVTLAELGLQVIVALAVWAATTAPWPSKVAVAAGVCVVWGAFFGIAERRFRRSQAR